jgi:ubiquinone/menaquinone biosynthesis C-methylase UbiE
MTTPAGDRPPTAYERGAREFFDQNAQRYDQNFDVPTVSGHGHRARLEAAVRLVGHGTGEVLEVGFGPGRLLEKLERKGWTGWGIDSAPGMLALARARVPAAAGRLALGHAEQLPFPDRRFDVVVCTGLLGYVGTRAALAELARVLRPGGRLVVSFRRRSPYWFLRDDVYYPVLRWARRVGVTSVRMPVERRPAIAASAAVSLVERAGLRVEAVESVGCMAFPQTGPPNPRSPALRAARAAEARTWARRLLATQVLVAARRER